MVRLMHVTIRELEIGAEESEGEYSERTVVITNWALSASRRLLLRRPASAT